jgi:hypothetical protein
MTNILFDNGEYTLIKRNGETRVIQSGEDVDLVAQVFFADEPPPPPPAFVTARQARLALLGAGMLANVDQALAGIEGIAGEAALIEWEYATEIRRDSPLIAALAPALGLTDEQIDNLFRAAEGL